LFKNQPNNFVDSFQDGHGQEYCQYPPGHPFALMLGLYLGAPWMIGHYIKNRLFVTGPASDYIQSLVGLVHVGQASFRKIYFEYHLDGLAAFIKWALFIKDLPDLFRKLSFLGHRAGEPENTPWDAKLLAERIIKYRTAEIEIVLINASGKSLAEYPVTVRKVRHVLLHYENIHCYNEYLKRCFGIDFLE
jgi:hypothetical protein